MTIWNDFNDAEDAQVFDIIPAGTLARVRMSIKPGGHTDAAQGWTDGLATLGQTGAVYLSVEFVVLEGPYARRKIWGLIGLFSPKGPEWANIGRKFIKSILNSAYRLSPSDDSPRARQARCIKDFTALDGLMFAAKIGIERDRNNEDRNVIKLAVTPEHKKYSEIMGPDGAPIAQPTAPTAPTARPAPSRPSWAQ
ncbi:MAG: hypothetical protein V6Z81_09965 [Parvularculales bacterium]